MYYYKLAPNNSNPRKVVGEALCFTLTGKIHTTSYHPKTNELLEKFNFFYFWTLFQMLAAYTDGNQRNWDLHLQMALVGYRTAIKRSSGGTPGELLYERQMRLHIFNGIYVTIFTHHYCFIF